MITVGKMVERGFVDVNNEPWLCLGVNPRAGQVLAVKDQIGKIKNDPCFSIYMRGSKNEPKVVRKWSKSGPKVFKSVP